MSHVPTQFDSPSYKFAKQLVSNLAPLFPNGTSVEHQTHTEHVKARMLRTGKRVLDRIDGIRTIFNDAANKMKDLKHLQLLREYEKGFFKLLEWSDCDCFNFMDKGNWEIIEKEVEKLRQGAGDLISTFPSPHIASEFDLKDIWRRIGPDQSRRRDLINPKPRLKSPFQARRDHLDDLLMVIETQPERHGSRHWLEERFFKDWCRMVGKELKRRYEQDRNVLLGFENWFGITTELQEIYKKPERAALTHGSHVFWTAMRREDEIKTLVDKMLAPLDDVPHYEEVIAEPPEYTEASLRQRRRVGLRQIVIRPDLRTRGLAEEGGLLI
ncbi:hypothetical protein JCM3766R1_006774 [Sporobolomyces carnicolor]